MARANLSVKEEVISAFLNAQEGRNVRIIKVRIVGEEMVLDQVLQKEGNVAEDFNHLLRNSLGETEACFALFCASDEDYGSLPWILIAWVPDGCRVRDKMLYSSSREDIKLSLGLGYFKSEYGANQIGDITWEAYENSLKKEFSPDLLTETERLVLEEKVCFLDVSELSSLFHSSQALTQKESGDVKASALGVIPFELSPEVNEKFEEFKNNNCNWISLTVSNEVVELIDSKTLSFDGALKNYIRPDVARYRSIVYS